MRKRIMLFVGFVAQLASIHAFSQTETATQPINASSTKSLLWKISGKNLSQVSYVFGTIHAICSADYFFTDKMRAAFNDCHQLVLEVNLNDTEVTKEFQEKMQLPEGKELSDYFSNENEYLEFASKLHSLTKLDIAMFSKFKPLVLISALSMNAFKCSPTSSYETNLIDLALENGFETLGLESARSQFEIFDNLTNEEIKDLLMESVQEEEGIGKTEEQMVDLYKRQDIEGLYQLLGSSKQLKGHEEEFLTKRNKHWVEQLPAIMGKRASFIAVGAAHLPGENGVLNLLRKAGYKVEAVN